MPVRNRKTLAEELRGAYEHSREEWAKRVADAQRLRDACATWRELDDATPEFFKGADNRRVRTWRERTGVAFTGNDEKLLGLLSSVAEKFSGLWLSAEDLAKRIGCCIRTVYNVTGRLEALDLIRIVPQYDDVDPYTGRQTKRGGGSTGKNYKRQQRPNAITFGQVGKALFGRVALSSKRLREGLAAAVDTLFVAQSKQTRQSLPSNPERIAVQDLLLVVAHAVNNPKPRTGLDDLPLAALENAAQARTRSHLHLV